MIEAKFLIYLIQVLHYNYVKNYCLKNKIKLYCFDLSKTHYSQIGTKLKTLRLILLFLNKTQKVLRGLIKLIYSNRHLPIYKIILGLRKRKKIFL